MHWSSRCGTSDADHDLSCGVVCRPGDPRGLNIVEMRRAEAVRAQLVLSGTLLLRGFVERESIIYSCLPLCGRGQEHGCLSLENTTPLSAANCKACGVDLAAHRKCLRAQGLQLKALTARFRTFAEQVRLDVLIDSIGIHLE